MMGRPSGTEGALPGRSDVIPILLPDLSGQLTKTGRRNVLADRRVAIALLRRSRRTPSSRVGPT